MAYNYYNPNQTMMNQLMRQKDSIENLINQYAQPQAPVQNIINTGTNTEFEARILNDNEEVDNILINKRTMFLDKKNKQLLIKELDGKISEQYEIVIPLDEKDKRILELEKRLKEMEDIINVKYAESIRSTDDKLESNSNDDGVIESTAKANARAISKSTK